MNINVSSQWSIFVLLPLPTMEYLLLFIVQHTSITFAALSACPNSNLEKVVVEIFSFLIELMCWL